MLNNLRKKSFRVIDIKSFKILRYPVFALITILILKFIIENILEVRDYSSFFNFGIITLTIMIFMLLVYLLTKRTEKITKMKKENGIRCTPLILWITAILLTFVGGLLLWNGFLSGIIFLGIGVVLWFESLTIRMIINKDGIIVNVHKFFPFPGIFYSFDDLINIKTNMKGTIIYLKHRQMFLGAKRFFIFEPSIFIREIEKNAPFKLNKT